VEKLLNALKSTADYFLGRSKQLSWRRLAVMLGGSGLLLVDKIDPLHWLILAAVFIGGETLEKFSKLRLPGA